MHGGIVATILDEISGRAHIGDPSQPRFMYTGKLEVKYRKNVPTGVPLKIVGKAGASKRRTAEGWAGIYHPDGMLLAEANALLFDLPTDTFENDDLEALGWKIYPDEK